MIAIKDTSVLISVLSANYDKILIDIIAWLTDTYGRTVVTCGYRPGDTGVHGTDPCRGIDIRSWVFTDPNKIVKHINKEWIYDHNRPQKKVAIFHDIGSGKHIHLQSHPDTKRR